jgi:hypothetical protein
VVTTERHDRGHSLRYQPTSQQVDELIRRAREHPLGTDYLLHGYLDSVAATFKVHGFTVEHARARIQRPEMQD